MEPKPFMEREEAPSQARIVRAIRSQVLLRPTDLENLTPADHRARGVWKFVQGMDLSSFYGAIESVEGRTGRRPCPGRREPASSNLIT